MVHEPDHHSTVERHSDIQKDTDFPLEAIPVVVVRAVRTKELPSRSTGVLTFVLGATPVRLLTRDPKRTRATVIAFDQDMIIGTTSNQALSASSGGRWPNLGPLVWGGSEELWATAFTGAGSCTVIIDQWED